MDPAVVGGATGKPGLFFLLHENTEWPAPEHAKFVPPGTEVCLVLDPNIYATSEDVSKIDFITRQCVFKVQFEFVSGPCRV